MNHHQLAHKLISSTKDERRFLFDEYSDFLNVELAETLRQICYEVWASQPQKVSLIAEILQEIAKLTQNSEINAYAEWTKGIENLVNGRLEKCLVTLNKSEKLFNSLGKKLQAATTQTSKIYALALLGRYDEAVACGLSAKEVFLENEDIYSVGKIEHNIGNLYLRRDLYRESEPFLVSAHKRFEQLGDQNQMAMLENNLAFTKSSQNQFREAEKIYKRGLKRCEENNLTSIQADIEASMSNLYLFQGKFDLALKFLERARQKYDLLKMPHQTATCELEIADIYLELNLFPEAVGFYEKTLTKFAELGMQAELARSLRNFAKVLYLLDEKAKAKEYLKKSEKLFEAEGNRIAAASVKFLKAQILFDEKNFDESQKETENARKIFKKGGNLRQQLFSEWLLGEIFSANNETEKAVRILRQTLKNSAHQSRQIEYLCLVCLGKILNSENYFLKAIEIIENSRSSLSGEEFRTAFLSDKLLPYNELVKMKLATNDLVGAFLRHESSRARTLFEALGNERQNVSENKKLNELREELNWYYSLLNRQSNVSETREKVSELRKIAEQREKEYSELLRRSEIDKNADFDSFQQFDLRELQKNLTEKTLIEFMFIDGQISAFVITDKKLEVFENYTFEEDVKAEVKQFLFQIKTTRLQEKLAPENRSLAFARMLRHSQKIYDLLLRPLEKFITKRQLIFAPNGILHYLPFHALHNGEKFLIEDCEISYTPSAAVLQTVLSKRFRTLKNALMIGVADKITPLVKTEVETLGKLFEKSVELLDEKANLKNLCCNIDSADVLHFACHGQFRPDNPAFSALALWNENLTVNDAQTLNLREKFVTLSACETGLNKIIAGEELIGLMRGFLSAGASSLVLSLWTVNDRSTLDLMKDFYRFLLDGDNPAKALQKAQNKLIEKNPHPYFWSPFVLIGHC